MATEYAVLYELAVHAPRMLNQGMLFQWVWGPVRVGQGWLLQDVKERRRHKLGNVAANPKYIFADLRTGYRMAAGKGQSQSDRHSR